MNLKYKFIVIEGLDGSGKATQQKLLAKYLKNKGMPIKTIDFPQYYNNVFGKLIGECLIGEHGDWVKIDPYIASTVYAADRFESSKKLKRWLKQGYIVISDRYVSSNQLYQGGKIKNRKEREKFLKWLDLVEYKIFNIPRPDIIIFLKVPIKYSVKLALKKQLKKTYRGDKEDVYETNIDILSSAYSHAIELAKENNNWLEINCLDDNGNLKSIEEIHKLILKALNI